MANEFDEFYTQTAGSMQDVGMGERTGCDAIARRNIVAVNERVNILNEKLSDSHLKIRGLEETIMEMRMLFTAVMQGNNELKAKLHAATAVPVVGEGAVVELPAHLR